MAITYAIDGGADAAKFAIDAASGVLTFKTAPDFEHPGDANGDNIYEVSVKATDAQGLSSSKTVRVTVTDVSEGSPPQITSAGAVTVKENSTAVMTVTATDPDDATQPPVSGDWPNASNTGVPAGTQLTNSGGMTISTANTVVEAKNISGTVRVTAQGVTIRKCKINGGGNGFAVDSDGHNVIIEDCEIWNASNSPVLCQGGKVLRCNLHHADNGVVTQGGDLVQDCYIHDLGITSDAHVDGISVQSGSGTVIRHNHVESFDTSCVFIKSDFTAVTNITVDNNRLINKPGQKTAATVYADNSTGKGMSGIKFTNNVMEKGTWYYAAITDAGTVVWTGNTDYKTGAALPTPAVLKEPLEAKNRK